ncbi:CapA family protein [Paracoccus sediminicola]|uniref:CapA family protein n=1 Tax=Paracoccus sediminicola TaxID=3017783 RepID=UPI0022F0BF58|nr:CapA family protein [Paracoccus sediminicola]WBU58136.1 CapA family protein [Paracoccus sediminicola]
MNQITIALVSDIYVTRPLEGLPDSAHEVFELLRRADLSIGNFEIPLSDRGAPVEKLLNIRAAPEIAQHLDALGLDAVTLANNHAVDYGWPALAQTRDLLRARGLRVVGAGEDLDAAMRPEICEVKGRRIGLIGFSCLLPGSMAAAKTRPGIAPIHVRTAYQIDPVYQIEEPGEPAVVRVRTEVEPDDLARACRAVTALKSDCDFVIVSIHWGYGSVEHQADYQMPLARALIEAGADTIHGHHPHSVQGIAFHAGRPILFSGNVFIGQQVFLDASDQVRAIWAEMSPYGYVARLRLEDRAQPGLEIIPIVLDESRLPVLARGEALERFRSQLSRLCEALGSEVQLRGDVMSISPLPGR